MSMAGATGYMVEEVAALALGHAGLILRNQEMGAEARLLPGQGANLIGLRLRVRAQTVEVMTPEPTEERPGHGFGAPVLFPFPNRLRAGRYQWQGRTYQLPTNRSGHAIHGLVRDRPFVVEKTWADAVSAGVCCRLRAVDHPELMAVYPFAFCLRLTYTLSAAGLSTLAEVDNEGSEPMPFGLGFHPYFRTPLGSTGSRADCRLQLWAPSIWQLDADSIATGRIQPVPPSLDARGYPALATTAFDTLYTTLALDDPGAGTWSSRYLDPQAGIEVVVVADAAYREAVLFAPLERPVVCIEPYTCATDALNLQPAGHDAGLIVLAPGDRWSAAYRIGARSVAYDRS